MRIHHAKFYVTFYISLGYALEAAFEGLLWSGPLIISENGSVCFMTCRNTDENLDLKTRSKDVLCITHVNMQYGSWKDEVEVVGVGEGEVLQVLRKPSMCLSFAAVNNAVTHCPYH